MGLVLEQIDGSPWERWGTIRLEALATEPDAFGATLELERPLDGSSGVAHCSS